MTPRRRSPVAPPALRAVPASAVRIAPDAVYAPARDRMLRLARDYPVDRLLAVFRRNAGLDTRGAQPPGAWEDFGHPAEEAWGPNDYPGAAAAQTANLLRGHYAGHFLSTLAVAAATTGDRTLRVNAIALVSGLAEVQETLARTGRYSHPGFLAAYGEWQFSRLEQGAVYGEIWAPYYTCHKIMAGLLDAHEQLGDETALRVAAAMAWWVHGRLSRLSPATRQAMWLRYIAGEYGGMNETLARLSCATGEPTFLETAAMFDQNDLLEAGRAGRDILTDRHANQHLPQLLGYVRLYEETGERSYLDAVTGLWRQVIPARQYAHGGTGESELWGAPGAVAGDIGLRNAETCATYNLVKLAHRLFAHTGDPAYLDYVERARLNHLLGARRAAESEVSPEITYMFPVHPGAVREYGNAGTCCGGTGLESQVGYGEGLAFTSPACLWVAQFVPGQLPWAELGLRLDVETQYPRGEVVSIRLAADGASAPACTGTLALRIPQWAEGTTVSVRGEAPRRVKAGEFARLTSQWAPGDEIVVRLPLSLRTEPTPDDPTVEALFVGPTLLLARDDATTWRRRRRWGARRWDGSLPVDHDAVVAGLRDHGTVRLGETEYEPCWSGSDARYHLYAMAVDETIAFAGVDTGVPDRRRPDGSTFLSTLWRSGAFGSPHDFLERVREVVLDVRGEGLLSRAEVNLVLQAAACSVGATDVRVEEGVSPALSRVDVGPEGSVTWAIPRHPRAQAAPVVTIAVEPVPDLSGWIRHPPRVSLIATPPEATCEYRIDGGVWTRADGVFTVSEGLHVIEARATVSELVGFAGRELAVDTEPPVSTAHVAPLGDAAVLVTLDAADGGSGVDRIEWSAPGTFWATFQESFVRALSDEEQVIEFAATDRAGNQEPRRRVTLPSRADHNP